MREVQIILFLAFLLSVPSYGSSAQLPNPPPTAIEQVVEGYGTAKMYLWHDNQDNFYVHIIPPIDGFSYFAEWAFIVANQACKLDLEDEYGTHIYGKLLEPKTYFLKGSSYAPDVCSTINLNSPTIIRWLHSGSATYNYYPSDFFTGSPIASPEQCNCPDVDKDGVPDAWDQCPNTQHATAVDSSGCKKMSVVVIPLATGQGN